MKLVTLACNSCGAPITVPESTNYLTCTHCGSQLSVRRGDGATYTAVLEQIDARTSRIEATVDDLRRSGELARIDRDWERERTRIEEGAERQGALAGVGCLSIIGAGLFGIGLVALDLPLVGAFIGVPMIVFGLLFLGLAVFGAMKSGARTDQFEAARRDYEARRCQIERSDCEEMSR